MALVSSSFLSLEEPRPSLGQGDQAPGPLPGDHRRASRSATSICLPVALICVWVFNVVLCLGEAKDETRDDGGVGMK